MRLESRWVWFRIVPNGEQSCQRRHKLTFWCCIGGYLDMRQTILNILYAARSCEGGRSVEFIFVAHYSFQDREKLVSRSCSSLIDLSNVSL